MDYRTPNKVLQAFVGSVFSGEVSMYIHKCGCRYDVIVLVCSVYVGWYDIVRGT
jgi:hypothetical protein